MGRTTLVIRRNKANIKGQCVIYVRYTHMSRTTYFSTGQMINPEDWNDEKSEVRKNRGSKFLNDLLKKHLVGIEDIKIQLLLKDIEPTIEEVKNTFIEKCKPQRSSKLDFFDYENEYLDYKQNTQGVSPRSMRLIRSFFNHMRNFEKYRPRKVYFRNIDESFHDEYVGYFFNVLNSSPNTIGGQIKFLKTYLSWTVSSGYNNFEKFRTFVKPKSSPEIIALTMEELSQLFKYDFSSNKRLERVRDMFILACSTGMRYSDFSRLTSNNIQGDMINIRMKKTKRIISIPLTDYSKFILKKYNYNLPKISNQNFNGFLKEAGKVAGLINPREITTYKGNKEKVENIPLYELLRSHIGRKTFVSLSLNKMSPRDVMAISGHRDFSTFEKYVTSSPKRLKQEMNKTWQLNEDE